MNLNLLTGILVLPSLFGAATLEAQTEHFGHITGHVFDKETLKPVAGTSS